MFNTKFFYVEANFSLAELGRIHQSPGEDLDTCMKRFHDKTLDCRDLVEEEVLVTFVDGVC